MRKSFKKLPMPKRFCRSVGVVYSCPRCGRPFVTEIERNIHMLSCGS